MFIIFIIIIIIIFIIIIIIIIMIFYDDEDYYYYYFTYQSRIARLYGIRGIVGTGLHPEIPWFNHAHGGFHKLIRTVSNVLIHF